MYPKIKNKKQVVEIILPFVMIIGALIIGICNTGIYFEINDDRYITEILSGSITGKPNSHVVFVNYLLSFPLSILYQLTINIPWYGCFLVSAYLVSFYVIFKYLIKFARTWLEMFFLVTLGGALFISVIYLYGLIQFTAVAAFLAIAGYVILFMNYEQKKGMFPFFMFELVSFFIREDAMLMVQPLGFSVILGLFLSEKKLKDFKKWRYIGNWFGIIISIVFIGYIGNIIGYHSADWRDYARYNKVRAELQDYYGHPKYEEVNNILTKYGISKIEYNAYCKNALIDGEIQSECLEQLVNFQKKKFYRELDFSYFIKKMTKSLFANEFWKLNKVVVATWGCIIVWLLLNRSWYLAVPLGGLFIARSAVWMYLFYLDRAPIRVMFPLFFAEILFIILLFMKDYNKDNPSLKRKVLGIGMWMMFGLLACASGFRQYRDVLYYNGVEETYIDGLNTMQEYCLENSDKKYILDMMSFGSYRGSAFETKIYGPVNGVYTNNWYTNSPPMKKRIEEYLGSFEEDIYYIVLDYENTKDLQKDCPGADYLTEKLGRQPVLADTITVSHGGTYLVYYYQADEK